MLPLEGLVDRLDGGQQGVQLLEVLATAVGRVLLEVESDNTPARTLYRDLGFRRIGGYHYRVGQTPQDPS